LRRGLLNGSVEATDRAWAVVSVLGGRAASDNVLPFARGEVFFVPECCLKIQVRGQQRRQLICAV